MTTHKMTYAQLEKLYEETLVELDRYRTRYGILAAEVSKLVCDVPAPSDAVTPEQKQCPTCSTMFISARNQTYCTDVCRVRAWRARGNVPAPPTIRVRNCKHCNKEFRTKRKTQIYCSTTCASIVGRTRAGTPPPPLLNKVCAWCRSEFTTTRKGKVYCTRKCCSEAHNHLAKIKATT